MLVVDTSTVSAQTARDLAAELAVLGVGFLDAPLSGGVEGAKNGKLSVMVGGSPADLERALSAMQTFAARITAMGPVGAGQATKAVNQIMIGGIAEGVCEALAFADALGLPREPLLQVLTAGAANSWFLEKRGKSMLEGRYEGGFKLGLLHKDLGIVRDMAAALGATLPTVERAFADYTELKARGCGEQEISSLYTLKRALLP
jgi:3-hydroxyisobutyrate dehydrogenase